MRENDDKYRVYLDDGVGQGPEVSESSAGAFRPLEDPPFCIGIVGDFSGRKHRPGESDIPDLVGRSLLRMNPEKVLGLGGLSPEIVVEELPGVPSGVAISFESLEDFHPDRLYSRLDLFARHRAARERLKAGGPSGIGEPEQQTEPGPRPDSKQMGIPGDSANGEEGPRRGEGGQGPLPPGTGLLDAVLGETAAEAAAGGGAGEEDLDAFLRRVVRPHVIQSGPDRSHQIEELDRQTSLLMASLLRTSAFREMESLWRSVVFLLSQIEVGTNLRVYLIDVSEQELMADLLSTDEPTEWGFAHTVLNPVSENGEELRWAALLGLFSFSTDPNHLHLLQRLGLLAESGGIPWFAGADSTLLGTRSLGADQDPGAWTDPPNPLWVELRGKPEAAWISLSLPGFFLRSPYGPNGGNTRSFRFDEAAPPPAIPPVGYSSLLWGIALAQAFAHSGWGLRLGNRLTVAQLPLVPLPGGHTSCVATPLSISAARRVREMGICPVVAERNEPQVNFPGMDSISDVGTPLGAWWKDSL